MSAGPVLIGYWGDVRETCGLDVLHHALSHGASVERVRALLGDPLVGVGQLREADDVVFLQRVPLGVAEDGAGGGTERTPQTKPSRQIHQS